MSSAHTASAEVSKGIDVMPPSPKELSIKERVEAIDHALAEADRGKLKGMDVATLRKTTFALLERDLKVLEKFPLKDLNEECLRRIRAYTDHCDPNGWYTLNYKQFDEGKKEGEMTHEMNVGLGEILVDAGIDKVLVRRKEGGIISGHRGIQAGRVCFLDDQNNYLATLTGDQFKILPSLSEENDTKLELQAKLENSIRESGEEAVQAIDWDQLPPELLAIKPVAKKSADVPLTDEALVERLEKHVEAGEGQKIVEYSRQVCLEWNLSQATFWAIVDRESRDYDPNSANPGSTARGLGQFLEGTWKDFMAYCNQKGIHPEEWGQGPLTQDSRFNPYISLYALGWYMAKTKKELATQDRSPQEQAFLLYLAHHEGRAGARAYLRFLEKLGKAGYDTSDKIRALAKDNPKEFERLAQGVLTKGPYSQMERIQTQGPEKFLADSYLLAQRVSEIAMASGIGKGMQSGKAVA